MGRAYLAKASVVELEKRIYQAKRNRQKVENYLKSLEQKYESQKVPYEIYLKKTREDFNGLTLSAWIKYYDKYILECEERISKTKSFRKRKRNFSLIVSFFILSVLIFSGFFFGPTFVGFVTQDNVQDFSDEVNLVFNESSVYEWNISNVGLLDYVKINGVLKGESNVKVYLDDYLIYDGSQQISNSVLTGNVVANSESVGFFKKLFGGLTGRAVEENLTDEIYSEELNLEEAQIPSHTNESSLASEENLDSQDSSSEEINSEEVLGDEENPSHTNFSSFEEPLQSSEENVSQEIVNETINNSYSEKIEEAQIPSHTNESSQFSETNVSEEEEIILEENITEEVNATKEIEIKIPVTKILEACEETCDLSDFDLNKNSYFIRVEISEGILEIDNFNYGIISEEIEVFNATNETLIQGEAVIGKPVPWEKHVELEEKGKTVIKLPKAAENIRVFEEGKKKEIEDKKEKENEEEKEVKINQAVFKVVVKYETEAPIAKEKVIKDSEEEVEKEIKISSKTHYINVKAYFNFSEEVRYKEQIELKEIVPESAKNVTIVDSNENGFYDSVQWVVDSLSNKTFVIKEKKKIVEYVNEKTDKLFLESVTKEIIYKENVNEKQGEEYVPISVSEIEKVKYSNENGLDAEIILDTPLFTLNKWNKEVQLSVGVGENNFNSKTTHSTTLNWTYDNKRIDIRTINESNLNEGGGIEFDVVLSEKPNNNVFIFNIDSKNLDFFYQPALDKEFGNLSCNETDCQGSHRPIDVVGSYAVYHKTKRDNEYKTGKAFHIYRPKVYDAEGDWIWGELNIEDSILSVTVDDDYLNNAVYPVTIDPIFGYNTSGGSWGTIAYNWGANDNVLLATSYTLSEAGTLDSITIYTKSEVTDTVDVTTAIYEKDGNGANSHSLIATKEILNLGASESWKTFNFSDESLSGSTDYLLVAQGDGRDVTYMTHYYLAYDTGTVYSFFENYCDYCEDPQNYPYFADPLAQSDEDDMKLSIYANYSEAETGENSTTIKLQNITTENMADIYYQGFSPLNVGSQIKWNISSIPSDQTITDATFCGFIQDKYGTQDNDVRVWRIDDQTWTEASNAATINAQSKTNQTDGTWSSTTLYTWACTNVTKMIQTDYAESNDYASLRFEDVDYLTSAVDEIHDSDFLAIGGMDPLNVFLIIDRENSGVLGEAPFLNITYEESGGGNNPPTIPSPIINSSAGTNLTTEDLNCSATISDDDSDDLNVSLRWYKNGGLNLSQDFNNSYSSGIVFSAVLLSANTSVGENWSCSMQLNDGTDVSDWGSSENLTIVEVPSSSIEIEFQGQTPDDEDTITEDYVFINVSSSSLNEHSVWLDWNKSLIGYWNFDSTNSTGVYDNSSYDNFASFKGGLGEGDFSSAKRGQGVDFDGDDDYFSTNLDVGASTDFSVSAWVKTKDNPSGGTTMVGGDVSSRILMMLRSDDVRVWNGSSGFQNTVIDNLFSTLNEWHHVVIVYDSSAKEVKGYADGDYSGSLANYLFDYGFNNLQIGGSGGTYNFNGSLDEVLIFDRVLNESEIKSLYNASVNQYYSNFTNLDFGTYSYTAYAIDSVGNWNSTEEREITISDSKTISISKLLPSGSSVNVTQNEFFEVNLNVTCLTGTCGTVNVSLDPENWWNSNWLKRKEINITNTYAGLTEYQIMLYINTSEMISDGSLQSDCDDLRFTNSAGTLIDYYIDEGPSLDCGEEETLVWLKTDSLTNATTTSFYMYYNNSVETNSLSNITSTFTYSTPKPIYYSIGDGTEEQTMSFISYSNNNEITLNSITAAHGESTTLSRGELYTGYVAADIANGDYWNVTGPIAAYGVSNSDTLHPIAFASNLFIRWMDRGTTTKNWDMLAPFADAEVYFWQADDAGGSFALINQISLTKGVFQHYDMANGTDDWVYLINSTSPILLGFEYGGASDTIVFPPASKNIWGLGEDPGYPYDQWRQVWEHDGTGRDGSVDGAYRESLGANADGKGTATHVTSDNWFGQGQTADGDGSEALSYWDEKELSSEYFFPVAFEYISGALTNGSSCDIDANGGTSTTVDIQGANDYPYPKRVFVGDTVGEPVDNAGLAGSYMNCTYPFFIYIENNAGEEGNNLGWKQSRQYVWPEPSYVLGSEENYSSEETKNGLVSTTPGATPFWTNATTNPLTTNSLSAGQSETITFWVNATGDVDSTHTFFAFANLTSNLSIGNITSTWNVTIVSGVVETDPEIQIVFNETITDVSSGPNEGPLPTYVLINFSAYDPQGYENLDDSKAQIIFGKEDEVTRSSYCSRITSESSGDYANYTCNVSMWWWDGAGDWTITAYIEDDDSNSGTNNSQIFSLGLTTGFISSPSELTWSGINPGATNILSNNDPILMNNTGNDDVLVQVRAKDLLGEDDASKILYSGNFSANTADACEGTAMENDTNVYVSGASLYRGNYTYNNGTAQEQVYFCLEQAGSELTNQAYSTSAYGSWTVRILLVFVVTRRRKKKSFKEDKLFRALILVKTELEEKYSKGKQELLNLLIEELKKKYSVNRKDIFAEFVLDKEIEIPISILTKELGALEAVVKYMKENLAMTYKEISKKLQRNERTIWNSYNKAKKKNFELIVHNENFISLNNLIDKNLTILESVVVYLKNSGLRYSEISELIDRDQRNVWKIYNKCKHKVGEKEVISEVYVGEEIKKENKMLKVLSLVKESLKEEFSEIKKRILELVEKEINVKELKQEVKVSEEVEIPISIFTKELGALESVVKYMKENLAMTYKEISEKLQRDERTIWSSYNKSKEKIKDFFAIKENERFIFLSRFNLNNLTVLENIILYLKNSGLRYSEISKLIDRDQRNIWTIYRQSIVKLNQRNI